MIIINIKLFPIKINIIKYEIFKLYNIKVIYK